MLARQVFVGRLVMLPDVTALRLNPDGGRVEVVVARTACGLAPR
ncbi:hypothetical protein [Mycobacterium uberis]|nr:hypothetical protein [Mycobacterium uberis]